MFLKKWRFCRKQQQESKVLTSHEKLTETSFKSDFFSTEPMFCAVKRLQHDTQSNRTNEVLTETADEP